MGGVFGGGGGGGKKGGSPAAPDFMGLAKEQSNQSRPNTSNAMGGQTWGIGPDGRPTSSTQFTGQAADTFNALQGGMNAAANYDPTKARDAAINQNMDFSMSRINPLMAQQNNAFASQMANSGMDPGTQGYGAANQQLGVRQSDLMTSALTNAMNQGNETQRTQMAQMNQPFQQAGMMNSMLNQQAPNYGQTPNLVGAAGDAYTAANRQAAGGKGKGQTLSTLGGLGGLAFGGPAGGMAGSAAGSKLGGGKGGAGAPADYASGNVQYQNPGMGWYD